MSTGKTTMAQGNETKRNLHICNICNAWNVQNILEKLIIKRGTDTAPLLYNLQQCMTITR